MLKKIVKKINEIIRIMALSLAYFFVFGFVKLILLITRSKLIRNNKKDSSSWVASEKISDNLSDYLNQS